ncbi:MAG: hypothetical protein R2748_02075 [Bryobacterales bacterium]
MTLTPEELADRVGLQFELSEDVGHIKVANFRDGPHIELREAIESLAATTSKA